MRMIAFAAVFAMLFLSLPVSASLVQVSDPVPLGEADQAAVEKAACTDPFHVPAFSATGMRSRSRGYRPLAAEVVCARHLRTEDYSAHYERWCEKRSRRWRCDESRLHLNIEFQARGPYDIEFKDRSMEEGLKALRCLEAGLREKPEIVGGLLIQPLFVGHDHDDPTNPARTEIYARNTECYRLVVEQDCDTQEPVKIAVTGTGCLYE